MICQHCKKKLATHNYISIIDGVQYASHLCTECYLELYGDLEAQVNSDIITGLFGVDDSPTKVCPVCGSTYSDYERTGLLGCASCYDVFKSELMPTIARIQGKVNHVGKVGTNNDEHGLHRRLKVLQEDLELALKSKKYDEAGVLNAKIEQIKKLIYGGKNDN